MNEKIVKFFEKIDKIYPEGYVSGLKEKCPVLYDKSKILANDEGLTIKNFFIENGYTFSRKSLKAVYAEDKEFLKILYPKNTITNLHKTDSKLYYKLLSHAKIESIELKEYVEFLGFKYSLYNESNNVVEIKSELKKLLEITSSQNNKLFNFTHIVSHNIRSHTSNLSMIVDVIENTDKIDDKLSYFELFKEGTDKLSESIEYLNEIISIQQNTNIKKKGIRLKHEIEKTKMALSLAIKESKIIITDTIPEDLIVTAIPAYLDSILINLFTNAIKYKSPERTATLTIGFEIIEDCTVIHFKDNGLGLNLEKNGHKLFGMYKTFHGNEDAKGIGLFITKNQLEAMEGKIEVESEVGQGSNFKIYLNEK